MKLVFLIVPLFVFICLQKGLAQEYTQEQFKLDSWAGQELLKHASVGVFMQDAQTGRVLASSEPQQSLVPASTLKLLTTGAALELLGADFRFETKLAYTGEIRNDSLLGDLVVIGGGDPALGSEYFKDHYLKKHFLDIWVDSLKQRNIHFIGGNIIVDASVYEQQLIPNTWVWEDIGNYFGAGACGLSVYDNLYEIHLSSPDTVGLQTHIVSTIPEIPEITFDNQVLSSDINRDRAYVFGSPLDNERVLRGTIPKGKSDFVIKASVPNPPLLLGWQLKHKIEDEGIGIEGSIDVNFQQGKICETTLLAKTISPALIDIISVTNHESVNLFAEHLLKHMAYLECGQGSTEVGVKVVADFWKSKGIETTGLFMVDGSGLSRFNAITAKQMVGVLDYMKNESEDGSEFINSLPTVPNGTLYYFHAEYFPDNGLYAKSGSMTRVRCFAGQLKTKSGREILFSVFLNNFSCSQSKAIRAIEDLLVNMSAL